jgi:septal ring factor EnvC (AmiA/AmiB activator)
MTTNENRDDNVREMPPAGPSRLVVALGVAAGLALVACVLLAVSAHTMSKNMDLLQASTQAQLAKMSDQVAQSSQDAAERIDSVNKASKDSAASIQEQARNDVRKTNAALAAKIAAQNEAEAAAQKQVASQLDELKQANSSASTKIDSVSGDLTSVKGDVANTQSDVQATTNELKRVNGDMGVMSGLIATNGKELAALRELGERNYVEFDLKRNHGLQKVGTIQLALSKVDPKRNRFTLDVLADDKRVEKRDKTVNEPVQLYISGSRQPVEIVVNEVKKDEVVGYLSVPKVKATRP